VGNDARSLQERLVEAQAAYNPLAQRVAAGDTSAYDDYSDAARTLLDLQRQIYGSSEDYFNLLDQVTALTKTRIDSETNVASIAAARDSIFSESQASVTPIVSATEQQTAVLAKALSEGFNGWGIKLDVLNQNLVRAFQSSPTAGNTALARARANF
jgi:multidrug efflux pump subunit AcrA (membrane-fusion protein)